MFNTVLVFTGVGRRAPLFTSTGPVIAANCDESYVRAWGTHYKHTGGWMALLSFKALGQTGVKEKDVFTE